MILLLARAVFLSNVQLFKSLIGMSGNSTMAAPPPPLPLPPPPPSLADLDLEQFTQHLISAAISAALFATVFVAIEVTCKCHSSLCNRILQWSTANARTNG